MRASRSFWPAAGALALVALCGQFSCSSASAQEPKPRKKDSPAALRKDVTWTTKVSPEVARPGDKVTYTITAKVAKPWHIYQFSEKQPATGPSVTAFEVFSADGLKPAKAWKSDRDPIRKKENAFAFLPFLEYFEGEVSWSASVEIPADTAPGKKVLKTQSSFQICNDKACQPPARATVPEAILTVEAGGSGGSAMLLVPSVIAFVPLGASGVSAEKPRAGSLEASIDGGLVSFLLFSAAGGLFAMLMPCVWPMIPITVNFFVKQGQHDKKRATILAVTYCLAIIGIFTGVGLAVTAAFGASGANQLGTNAWVNLVFAIVFVAFGLSLMGLFELRLPSAWLNASAQREGKGGLIGVMFMALTLTITSFTCTAPVVGSLLFLATKGQYFYPVLGLLTFSAVLSIPFFVMAMAPGLLSKIPKSGDWMNAVKVVGGLLEIAAAFKFLNVAEVSFHGGKASEAFFDAQVVLSIWVVTAVVAGLYLIGMFRTDHDHDAVKVGPGRLVLGTMFLALALFLAPALFGMPPRSKLYDKIAGIFPPDAASEFNFEDRLLADLPSTTSVISEGKQAVSNSPDEPRGEVHSSSNDPKVAVREERRFHGVSWGLSLDAALERAKLENKPVLIDFTGVQCANCRTMEAAVMPKPEVIKNLRNFVTVQLYTDFVPIDTLSQDQREELAAANIEHEQRLAAQITSPLYVILDPDGKVLATKDFDDQPSAFVRFLEDGVQKLKADKKMASAGG